MSLRASRWLLFALFACVVPVPFFLVEVGQVPAVRILLLGAVVVAVWVQEGGQGMVGVMAGLLLGQAALALALLFGAAHAIARGLGAAGPRGRAVATGAVLVLGLLAAVSFDLYHTPFRTRALHGNLLEVFE